MDHIDWNIIFSNVSFQSISPALESVTIIQHAGFNALIPFCSWLDGAESGPSAYCNFSPSTPLAAQLFFHGQSSSQSLGNILPNPSHPGTLVTCIYPNDDLFLMNPVQPLDPKVGYVLFLSILFPMLIVRSSQLVRSSFGEIDLHQSFKNFLLSCYCIRSSSYRSLIEATPAPVSRVIPHVNHHRPSFFELDSDSEVAEQLSQDDSPSGFVNDVEEEEDASLPSSQVAQPGSSPLPLDAYFPLSSQ